MHSLRCMHAQVSQPEAAQKHTHIHTQTHTHTHKHTHTEQSTWCGVVSYTHHTHIIHTPYTHHTQHMHASRCMYAQVSQPKAAQKHTHTHIHTQREQSTRCGVVSYTPHTHIIHTSYTHHTQHMHASCCMHAQVSQPEAAQKHTHTHTHTHTNKHTYTHRAINNVWCCIIHISHTTYACIALHACTGQPA